MKALEFQNNKYQMKKGIVSVGIAIVGIYFVYWHNRSICEGLVGSSELTVDDLEFSMNIFADVYKIIATSIGLLSLYIGIISMKSKSKISILGIVLSIILILLSFLPLCEYFLQQQFT